MVQNLCNRRKWTFSGRVSLNCPHPEGLGAISVMKQALKEANISPSDTDYINVHGTSTPLGDIAETKAIKHVLVNMLTTLILLQLNQ